MFLCHFPLVKVWRVLPLCYLTRGPVVQRPSTGDRCRCYGEAHDITFSLPILYHMFRSGSCGTLRDWVPTSIFAFFSSVHSPQRRGIARLKFSPQLPFGFHKRTTSEEASSLRSIPYWQHLTSIVYWQHLPQAIHYPSWIIVCSLINMNVLQERTSARCLIGGNQPF